MTKTSGKILLISSEFPPNVGGIGNHAYNLAKALSVEGFEVDVVTDIIDVDEVKLKNFALQQTFKIHWVTRKKFVFTTYYQRIFTALSVAKSADKVICSGKFPLWLAIFIRFNFPSKQLIAVVHGTELDLKLKWPKRLTDYALGKFNKIIAVSNYTKQFLPPLPSQILQFVIHNGIENDEFKQQGSAALTGDPALITVGNVTERKGQENVINTLPEILATHAAAYYHIVGKPTDKVNLENKAKLMKLEKNVIFHGAVSREELLQKLQRASIKLMLSNHTLEGDFEGFGIAILEANAFGVPAIGSKDCGIADAIVHGKTGLLVDQYNTNEVAAAVTQVMSNYTFFSHNAKEWARQHDWKIIVKKYVEVLNA